MNKTGLLSLIVERQRDRSYRRRSSRKSRFFFSGTTCLRNSFSLCTDAFCNLAQILSTARHPVIWLME